jgi:hypothetical protein
MWNPNAGILFREILAIAGNQKQGTDKRPFHSRRVAVRFFPKPGKIMGSAFFWQGNVATDVCTPVVLTFNPFNPFNSSVRDFP